MTCPCVVFEAYDYDDDEEDDYPGLCICGHTEEEHRDGFRECEHEGYDDDPTSTWTKPR